MSKVTLIENKPLIEDIFSYDIILLGTGIHNTLGNGFLHDIKINFPFVDDAIKKTPYGDVRKLGTVTVIKHTPLFCVGFIHKGAYRKDLKPDYVDYEALKNILELVDGRFSGQKIACTLIGCSPYDGGGNEEKVREMFNELSGQNEYFIYTYEQRDYRTVNNEKWSKIIEQVGKIPYEELRALKDRYIKERKYGIYGADKH